MKVFLSVGYGAYRPRITLQPPKTDIVSIQCLKGRIVNNTGQVGKEILRCSSDLYRFLKNDII